MSFNIINYFDSDVEFGVKNEYETRNQNFKFISQLDVKCEICNAPVVSHDMLIDWNSNDSEVKNQWDFSVENVISIISTNDLIYMHCLSIKDLFPPGLLRYFCPS